MHLNPKLLFALALSMTLAWMFVEPTTVCAQMGSQGHGGSMGHGGHGHSQPSHGGNHGMGNHHPGHAHFGGSYYGGHSGFRPSFNQLSIGPSGIGYSYYGSGFGLSIGLPSNRYYNNYGYGNDNNYNMSRAYYYVEPYPQPAYSEYVFPSAYPTVWPAENIGVLETGLVTPSAAKPGFAVGPSIIASAVNASEYQSRAEQAFRNNQYQDAARLSTHAIIEDGENGKLHLFASQVFFAIGDYRASAAAIQRGTSLLDKNDWGYVVQNFKLFYRGKDYVKQMDALIQFTKSNPDLSYVHLLRGYHYKYLGYDEAARAPLTRAVELESRDRLAAELLVMAGGKLPEEAAPATLDKPDPAKANDQLLNVTGPEETIQAKPAEPTATSPKETAVSNENEVSESNKSELLPTPNKDGD